MMLRVWWHWATGAQALEQRMTMYVHHPWTWLNSQAGSLGIELCLWIVHITIFCCHAWAPAACSLIGFRAPSTSPGWISVPSLHVTSTFAYVCKRSFDNRPSHVTEACLGVAVLIGIEIYFCEGCVGGWRWVPTCNICCPRDKDTSCNLFTSHIHGFSARTWKGLASFPGLGMRLGKDITRVSTGYRATSTYVFLLTTICKHCIHSFSCSVYQNWSGAFCSMWWNVGVC